MTDLFPVFIDIGKKIVIHFLQVSTGQCCSVQLMSNAELPPLLSLQRSRAALQRYLFYCNRYMNHMQSLRFEHKLYAQVKQKMEEMQQHNMSWIEVQFLKKAVDVLCQCRSTLMFTYVFAFYLKKNNQSIIFEVC